MCISRRESRAFTRDWFGIIPRKYKLTEMDSEIYSKRTLKNVQISDATLIIYKGETTGGSTLTEQFCRIEKKPLFKMGRI